MNIPPRDNLQSRRAFGRALFFSLLSMNAGCKPQAPKKDLRQAAESLAKKTVEREQLKAAQNEKEQYFIAKLQDLNSIEDKNTLYTKLNDLCKEALIYNGHQMLNGGGRSLKIFSEQLEAFVKDHLPNFTMQYDLPTIKGENPSSYQMAVKDNQLFMSIEITCRSLRKETQRN